MPKKHTHTHIRYVCVYIYTHIPDGDKAKSRSKKEDCNVIWKRVRFHPNGLASMDHFGVELYGPPFSLIYV